MRSGLVLVPVGILSFGVSVFFSFKGILNLDRFKRGSNSDDESKKLNSHILGMFRINIYKILRNVCLTNVILMDVRYGNSNDACGIFPVCILHERKL